MVISVTGNTKGLPEGKVHGANMGPIWVLSVPNGPHVGPMNLAIRVIYQKSASVHVMTSSQTRYMRKS